MKKLLTVITLACGLALHAQTNTAPVSPAAGSLLDFIGASSTNWYGATYGIYDQQSKTGGAGVGLAYSLADQVIMPTVRLEYIDSQVWLVNGSLELRPPQKWLGRFPVRPFATGGVATPFSGKEGSNGDVVGLVGIGASTRLGERWGLIGAAEWRTGGGFSGWQYRLGLFLQF